MENSKWQDARNWFRKSAGTVIGLLGIYFIVYPFVAYL
jgi:cytochrome c-type biogenesis protein